MITSTSLTHSYHHPSIHPSIHPRSDESSLGRFGFENSDVWNEGIETEVKWMCTHYILTMTTDYSHRNHSYCTTTVCVYYFCHRRPCGVKGCRQSVRPSVRRVGRWGLIHTIVTRQGRKNVNLRWQFAHALYAVVAPPLPYHIPYTVPYLPDVASMVGSVGNSQPDARLLLRTSTPF